MCSFCLFALTVLFAAAGATTEEVAKVEEPIAATEEGPADHTVAGISRPEGEAPMPAAKSAKVSFARALFANFALSCVPL